MPDRLFEDTHLDDVFSTIAPKVPSLPLVFDSPHSGLTIPRDFKPAVSDELVRVAADTYVEDLFRIAPEIGAPLLYAHFPRSFLDLNRSTLDVDLEMIDGEWPHAYRESPSAKRGMGLIWRYAWGDQLMYNHKLSVAEVENRIDKYWHPYHQELVRLLDKTHVHFGYVYHINCHSMPAIGHALSPDPAGTVRADIVVGDYDGISSEPEFVNLVVNTLSGFGYSVSRNIPFKGAQLVSAYSNPENGRHSIQIELNRKLYMDETTREKTNDYNELQNNLSKLGHVIADYTQSL
ncbi:N-formylglutamate amidohydrolase [Brucellaceae bacterium C25G]